MAWQKCPACDGYGTRPSRKTAGKFVRCKACKGACVLFAFDLWSTVGPIQFGQIPTVDPPLQPGLQWTQPEWTTPLAPPTPGTFTLKT